MLIRSIEIHYDTAAIPGLAPGDDDGALDFRDAAIELIEDALLDAGAGEWESAQLDRGEVTFAFMVDDFDTAEKIVRRTVRGTPYEPIATITRTAFDTAALPLPALH